MYGPLYYKKALKTVFKGFWPTEYSNTNIIELPYEILPWQLSEELQTKIDDAIILNKQAENIKNAQILSFSAFFQNKRDSKCCWVHNL